MCRPWSSATSAIPAAPCRFHAQSGQRHERILRREFLLNAQGEDVVPAGSHSGPILELEKVMPDVYNQLRISRRGWRAYKDMQDFEFTIQDRKLYMLQDPQRQAHRTGCGSRALCRWSTKG